MVIHACNSNTWKTDTGLSGARNLSQLAELREHLCQRKKWVTRKGKGHAKHSHQQKEEGIRPLTVLVSWESSTLEAIEERKLSLSLSPVQGQGPHLELACWMAESEVRMGSGSDLAK